MNYKKEFKTNSLSDKSFKKSFKSIYNSRYIIDSKYERIHNEYRLKSTTVYQRIVRLQIQSNHTLFGNHFHSRHSIAAMLNLRNAGSMWPVNVLHQTHNH